MGIENIRQVFRPEHKAFIAYLMCGHPTPEATSPLIHALVDAGVDLLELGVPFSDPLADGPVIQAAGQQALANGITLEKCIRLAAELRREGIHTPIVLMSYLNPILAYGADRCVADCSTAGVDGFIIPDLPPEEAEEIESACQRHNLALVYLLSPVSPPERIQLVSEKSTGFIYLVSLTGVTGARSQLPDDLADFAERVRAATDKPLAFGFGIGNGEQARLVSRLADGVIVGSALVQRAGQSVGAVAELAQEIRQALG